MRRADLSASGERGAHAATVFVLLALVGLAAVLNEGNLTYRYVANWTSFAMAAPYRMAAVWVGPSGALLVWAFFLGLGASIAAVTLPRGGSLRAWTVALLGVMVAAVIAMACVDANPFRRLPFPPDDGRGMPLEWQRPVVLLQMPIGYLAMSLLAVPAVITVMGALGETAWRDAARRWASAALALAGAALLADWRRRYGDAAWADAWQWAPLQSGAGLAFVGALALALVAARRAANTLALGAGFAAFTLALAGLAMRRAFGWGEVLDVAASPTGRALGWSAGVVAVAAFLYALWTQRGARGLAVRATQVAYGAMLVVAASLAASNFARTTDVAVQEGQRARVADRFGTAWTLSLEGVSQVGREAVLSNVVAVRAAVGGKGRAFVTAEVRSLFTNDSREPADQLMLSGVSGGLLEDLRVDVREANTADAVLTVRFVPAVTVLWIAGVVAVLALLVSAFAPAGRADAEPQANVDAPSSERPTTDAGVSA